MEKAGVVGVAEGPLRIAVNFTCAAVYWTEENRLYEESKELAGEEAMAIGNVLNQAREQMTGRG